MRSKARHREVPDLLLGVGAIDVRTIDDEMGDRWEDQRSRYRSRWQQRYGTAGRRWEDYEPAYRFGWERSRTPGYRGRRWSDVEAEFRRDWESRHEVSPWARIADAVRDAWEDLAGEPDRPADRAA